MTTQQTLQTEEYKQTELGELPKEWDVVKLDTLFKEVNKKTRKISIKSSESYKLVLTKLYAKGIRLKEIKEGKKISAKFMFEIKEGDFIFSKINLRKGSFDFVPKELNGAVVSTEHPILNLNKEKADSDFLKRFLSQPYVWGDLKEEAKGFAGKERIKTKEFLSYKIPLPPLPEQQKIAHVLSTVQIAQEKTENFINSLKELEKSTMRHLFTYGAVSFEDVDKVELKETEIGMMPKSWDVVELGQLLENKKIEIQFGFPCGKWNADGVGVPHIRPFNIKEDGKVSISNLKYIEYRKELRKYLLKKADILFNNTNSTELVGKTSCWNFDGEYVISNHMTFIRVLNNNVLIPFFVSNFLHKRWSEGYFRGICMRHVNQSSISHTKLSRLKIPLPPLPIQQKIALILSAIDEKIQAEEQKKEALKETFNSLLRDLMTAKIRVPNLEKSISCK